MMPNTPIVSRDLDKARRDLEDATTALQRIYAPSSADQKIVDLHEAVEAAIRAISSVALSVQRLAELPACDGGHAA